MKKTIVTCAVTGNIVTREHHPRLPVTPRRPLPRGGQRDNAQLVEKAVRLIGDLGGEIATASEARAVLHLKAKV